MLDVLSEILSGGRTSTMYKDMVRDKQIALGAGAQSTFPAGKYPSLFLFYVAPASGHTIEENEKEVYSLIEQAKKSKARRRSLAACKDEAARGSDSQAGE